MPMMKKQRGMTFFGLIVTAIVIVFVGLIVVQAIPTYIEYLTIQKAVQKSSTGTTVAEVRSIFEKASAIDNISSIKAKDLDVSKQGDRVVVSYAYSREIALFGPAYLVMKYAGSSK